MRRTITIGVMMLAAAMTWSCAGKGGNNGAAAGAAESAAKQEAAVTKVNVADYAKEDVVKRQTEAMFRDVADNQGKMTIGEMIAKHGTKEFSKLYTDARDKDLKFAEGRDDYFPTTNMDPWCIKDMGNLQELAGMTVEKLTTEPAQAVVTMSVNCYVPSSEECPECDGWNETPVRVTLCLEDTTWKMDNSIQIFADSEENNVDYKQRLKDIVEKNKFVIVE